MAMQRQQKAKKLFISWSGTNSKEIALKLKEAFEDKIFSGSGLQCFVSDVDIGSGTDWWTKIQKELKSCTLGIAVVTKENLSAPWLYFESGAIVARDKPLIPLLFNCGISKLDHTPLTSRQTKDFYVAKQFKQMVQDINDRLGKPQPNRLISAGYEWLKTELDPISQKQKKLREFNMGYVYPKETTAVTVGSIFVSSPMAALEESEYTKLHEFIVSLETTLTDIGFTKIISPVSNNKSHDTFEGPAAAIQENYPQLKSVESMLVIIPKLSSFTYISSIWLDIGYCLALTKNIVIFHEDKLPYMLSAAGSYINHVHTYEYKYDSSKEDPYEEIREMIKKTGMAMFKPLDGSEE